MENNFNLCGLNIEVEHEEDIELLESAIPFLCEKQRKTPDVMMTFHKVEKISVPYLNGYREGPKYFVHLGIEEHVYLYFDLETMPYAHAVITGKAPLTYDVEYTDVHNNLICDSYFIWNMLGLEELFLHFDAFMLHSSVVQWGDSALLFSGPSGIGKSTQAELWKENKQAEIINGDRAGIRISNGLWTAYGLPFAGSSKIYKNKCAPVKSLLMLEQGIDNKISRLSPIAAFRKIYPQVTVHTWDSEFVQSIFELVYKFTTEVPVYSFRCKPDESAVEFLSNAILHN